MDGRRIRLVLADDHPVLCRGLRSILEREADMQVLGEAASGEETLRLVRSARPDVLLLDVNMPGGSGLDVLRELAGFPTRVIFFTADIGTPRVFRALDMGLRGLVMKNTPLEVLLKSVRCVAAGEYWIDRNTLTEWARNSQRHPAGPFSLTGRQLEVVAEVASGSGNRDIARKLSVTEDTVKRHLTHIYDKLGVCSRVELTLFAVHHGLTETTQQG